MDNNYYDNSGNNPQNTGYQPNQSVPYGQDAPGYDPYAQNYAPQPSNLYYIPPEVSKWNWGAFMFNIVWGIGNHAWLTLLCLIPCLNIVWMFVCGALGNKWAWKSGEFKDVETFLAVQRTWNRAGLVCFIIYLVFIVFYVILLILGVGTGVLAGLMESGYYY